MAVALTELTRNLLYRLTVTGETGPLEVLRWDCAAGTFSSPYALPQKTLDMLARRAALFTQGLATLDTARLIGVPTRLLHVCDLGESATVTSTAGASHVSVELVDLSAATTYYIMLSVPHSTGSPLV